MKYNYYLSIKHQDLFNHDYELTLNDVKIKKVNSTKKIGVCIDHKLTWKEHISSVCHKESECTAIINRFKHIVNKDSLGFFLYFINRTSSSILCRSVG